MTRLPVTQVDSTVLPVSFFDQTALDSRFCPLESRREYWTCVQTPIRAIMTAIIKRIDDQQNKIHKKSDYNSVFFFCSCQSDRIKEYWFVQVVNYLFIVIPLIVWQYLWHKTFEGQANRANDWNNITTGLRIANCPDAQLNLFMVEDLNAGLAVSVRLELGVVLLKILTPANHFFFSSFFLIYFQFLIRCRCSNLFKTFAFYDHKFILSKCPSGSCHLSL